MASNIADLIEAWGLTKGDRHTVTSRYRREQWWIENQDETSLQVTPADVARLLDYLADAIEPLEVAG